MKSITANEGSPLAPIYSSTSSWSGIRDAILQALSKFIDLTNDLVDAANQDMIGWALNNMCWLGTVHAMALIGVNLLKSLSWASMVHILMRWGEESSGTTRKIWKILKLIQKVGKLYKQGDHCSALCCTTPGFIEIRAITGDTEFIIMVKRIQHSSCKCYTNTLKWRRGIIVNLPPATAINQH